MCGIFGVIAKEEKYNRNELVKLLEDVAKLSQVRGKDSSGFAVRFEKEKQIDVLKGPVSIDNLLRTDEYKSLKNAALTESKIESTNNIFAALGHARLVTNGSQLKDVNNQPVIKDGIIGVHNGIIVNEEELWGKYPEIKREYEIDTEVIYSLFRRHLNLLNNSIEALKYINRELFGTVSTGFFINDREEFILYTNNGSLYVLTDFDSILIYSSERNILSRLIDKHKDLFTNKFVLNQVPANHGYLLELHDLKIIDFDLQSDDVYQLNNNKSDPFSIEIKNYHPRGNQLHAVLDPKSFTNGIRADTERDLLEYNIDRISQLRRCTKCLLPETFPFINFDEQGVCNICQNYVKKNQPKSLDELKELVEPYRRKDGQPDCLVPFSGGRDSTYVLHIVKNILKMNPIAFTYDWGMVTDLGRRNIARVTGKMGVENIIVSADIRWKRENIRKNISAWLKNPELGMIPLFMAGDKFFFYYTDKVKKQNDIHLNIWGINPLENTDFKVGFCGLPLRFNKKRIYSISIADQLKLFGYVGKNILKSPAYLNQSISDTLGSFASRYIAKKKDYYHMFDYYEWDEKEIEDLIKNEYKWETAIDTKTTWRIGDGTAGFYNYVYYTVAGFSEYDTFRSNQIREGMMTREEALKLVNEENRPRYESIKWYLEIIGLDFESVIKRINQIPKLY
jgi:glutamine---fructose-6-phosphate transaminase (isomerizing)